ncbi:MAG: fatty acid desaturase [Dongiaceae bacterium]
MTQAAAGAATAMEGQERVRAIVSRSEIQALCRRSDRPGLIFLAGHLATLLATGLLIWATRGTGWILAAMFLHGVVIVHLFAPFHEAAHGTAFRSRWINVAVAWATGLVLMLGPLYFKYEHIAHHSHTQHPGKDPQMIPIAERLGGYLYYATAIPYFIGVFRSLANHALGRFSPVELAVLPPAVRPAVRREARLMWAAYLAVAAASLLLQSWAALAFWLVPRVIGEPVMRLIRMSEHVGRPRVPDLLRNTRSVETLAPIRWLAWNNAYHAEHHAIPLVPFFALPALHARLGPHLEEVAPGYLAAQLRLIRNGLAARA